MTFAIDQQGSKCLQQTATPRGQYSRCVLALAAKACSAFTIALQTGNLNNSKYIYMLFVLFVVIEKI